ncbi:MAG: hypothetical protein Tsb0014_40950 [Pleurocapsa sp.]
MAQSTQAHLSRTVQKDQPLEVRHKTLSQMQYYMGAKLIEVGIDPQSVMYRWSVKNQDNEQICTLSAFWGESRAKLLSGETPLSGAELIDCARANTSAGVATAAKLCGYASDLDGFKSKLKQTIAEMEVSPESFKKLID